MSKGLCLCSGGLDSSLTLLKLLELGYEVTPVYVDYIHWATEGELPALWDFLSWVGQQSIGSLTDLVIVKVDLGLRVGGVWGRSIALVGLAAMWAFTHGNDYDFIALGNHKGDVCPDCKPGLFDKELDTVLKVATKDKIQLLLPIADLTIEDIGKELAKYCVPWDIMYSCYWYPNCQFRSENDKYLCPGCRRKIIAMQAAGVSEDKLYPPNGGRTYYPENTERLGY